MLSTPTSDNTTAAIAPAPIAPAPIMPDPITPDRGLLDVRDLTVRFRLPHGLATAVDKVSLQVKPGEILGVVGESGSGKSQILLASMGLLARNGDVSGSIRFQGQELLGLSRQELDRQRGAAMAMIFQDPMTSLNPYHRIGAQLAEVLIKHRGMARQAAWNTAAEMLDRVKIPDVRRRIRLYPHELSGGMRQRVMIAMALLCRPRLLLADEPTTALDVTVQAQILALLKELVADSGTAVILVTHDLGVVAETCDRVTVLYGGRVMETASTDDLFVAPAHPYTRGLLESIPRLEAERQRQLRVIPGAPRAAQVEDITGCPFEPRCGRRIDACRAAMPLLMSAPASAGNHLIACHRPHQTVLSEAEEAKR